ncbi:MAG: hypothetical protein R3E01_35935 [Pirellulaceae bacterium]
MESNELRVVRISEPRWHVNTNRVDVQYTILIENKKTQVLMQLAEVHPMRYFFAPELELIANAAGLSIIDQEEWLTGRPPGSGTFGMCFVAQKV